jgi:hypothetical protein
MHRQTSMDRANAQPKKRGAKKLEFTLGVIYKIDPKKTDVCLQAN